LKFSGAWKPCKCDSIGIGGRCSSVELEVSFSGDGGSLSRDPSEGGVKEQAKVTSRPPYYVNVSVSVSATTRSVSRGGEVPPYSYDISRFLAFPHAKSRST